MIKNNHSSPSSSSSEGTRRDLVESALRLFGENGFDGTSTREIAKAAGANIGSIAYHFGGKERLYLACADHIVETLGRLAAKAFASDPLPRGGPREGGAVLEAAIERMVAFVVAGEEAGDIVRFILRELQHPTDALNTVYGGVFEPVHRRLCHLWQEATGEPAESEEARLAVFTLLGQVLYFRIAREAVKRRMGWTAIDAAESAAIARIAKTNLRGMLEIRKSGGDR